MKKRLLKFMVMKILFLGLLVLPTVTLSPETEVKEFITMQNKNEEIADIIPLENDIVSVGAIGAINEEPEIIFMYSTTIVKIHREPLDSEDTVVGLIPAGAEMLWVEDVDDIWTKVEINDVEYFICKDYITTIVPEKIVLILNIEPTHEGIYFVNEDGQEVSNPNYVSLGEFKLTAYCPCSKCCGKWASKHNRDANGNLIVTGAIGERLYQGVSIAVDPKVIPYYSNVYIDGHKYAAHDCGGSIKGNRIDVYFEDHDAARKFGVQYKEVFIWKY